MKDKTTAALLAFFLGGFGVHRFYLGQTGTGFLCLIFFWTFIPAFIALIDFIIFLTMSPENFNRKYNPSFTQNQVINHYMSTPNVNVKDVAAEIKNLHSLKEKGIISDQEFEDAKNKLLS